MTVSFYGSVLDHTAGEKSFETGKCSTVKDLVDELGSRFGGRFKEFLTGEENCFFLVNGKGIMMTGGLDTGLHPDDKVEVIPFAGAG